LSTRIEKIGTQSCKARIRLEIKIEIGLEFNQSEGRKQSQV